MSPAAKKKAPEKAAANKPACQIKDCKRPYRAKGYCVTHYQNWRRGEIEGHRARYNICSKEGCRKPTERGGLCAEHNAKPAETQAA